LNGGDQFDDRLLHNLDSSKVWATLDELDGLAGSFPACGACWLSRFPASDFAAQRARKTLL
jgi:hypothetical protein